MVGVCDVFAFCVIEFVCGVMLCCLLLCYVVLVVFVVGVGLLWCVLIEFLWRCVCGWGVVCSYCGVLPCGVLLCVMVVVVVVLRVVAL